MELYKKSDLSEISILQFSKRLENSMTVNNLVDLAENDENFVFYDADVFCQGVCQLFAYALHKKFGYKVYIIIFGNGCHIFCKTADGQYVDVRGNTPSFREFISGLELPNIKNDISELYSFHDNDFNGHYHDIALAFAYELIEHDIQRYKID